MRRLAIPLLSVLLLAAAALAPTGAWAQSDSGAFAQTRYHGEGYINFVDPDRARVGFTDLYGATYTLDTFSSLISVPALATDHATTGDLVKDMRIEVDGYQLSPTIIEAEKIRVLPYVPRTGHPVEAPVEAPPALAPAPAPVEPPPAANGHIDLEGTVDSYHPMEQTGLDYDIYTVHVNDHERNVRVGGPDVVRSSHGDEIDGPLAPGDRVHVTGTLLMNGDVNADRVVRLAEGVYYPGQKHFEGGNVLHGWITTSASFFSRDLTVRVRDTDVNVQVPGGIPVREDGHPISVHDLGNHEHVTVYGQWLGGSDFRADRIDAESYDNDDM